MYVWLADVSSESMAVCIQLDTQAHTDQKLSYNYSKA